MYGPRITKGTWIGLFCHKYRMFLSKDYAFLIYPPNLHLLLHIQTINGKNINLFALCAKGKASNINQNIEKKKH